MSKTISKLLLNGEEYRIKDTQLSDRVTSLETLVGDGVDVDLSGFYTKTEVDNKLATAASNVETAVNTKVAEIVGGAPEQLDTLKEIADTLNKDTEGGVVNAIFAKIDDDKTELSDRIDTLEAIDHTQYLTEHQDLSEYAKTSEMNSKLTEFSTQISETFVDGATFNSTIANIDDKFDDYATSEYVDDEIKEIADGVDVLSKKVDAIESYDDTDVKARLDDLEAVDHTQYLTNSSLDNYYTSEQTDNKISLLATAVDNTLDNYATTATVNTQITNLTNKVDSKSEVAVHKNGEFLNAQPNVMYFVYEEEETEEPDGRTPLKIKVIDNSDGGVDFASGELITISNEQTHKQFIKPINYFTSGPVDTVLAKETDTISVMCGSAQYGVVAFNGCASNQYIVLEITASTTDRVVNGGVYWLENDQPVNNQPDIPTPTDNGIHIAIYNKGNETGKYKIDTRDSNESYIHDIEPENIDYYDFSVADNTDKFYIKRNDKSDWNQVGSVTFDNEYSCALVVVNGDWEEKNKLFTSSQEMTNFIQGDEFDEWLNPTPIVSEGGTAHVVVYNATDEAQELMVAANNNADNFNKTVDNGEYYTFDYNYSDEYIEVKVHYYNGTKFRSILNLGGVNSWENSVPAVIITNNPTVSATLVGYAANENDAQVLIGAALNGGYTLE